MNKIVVLLTLIGTVCCAQDWVLFKEFKCEKPRVRCVKFRPTNPNHIAVVCEGATAQSEAHIEFYDISIGKLLWKGYIKEERMLQWKWGGYYLDFFPQDNLIIGAGQFQYDKEGALHLAQILVSSFTLLDKVNPGAGRAPYCVKVSPAGNIVASSNERSQIILYELTETNTLKEIKSLTGHKEPVVSLAFSPDGKKFASGSNDNTIKIWEVETGKLLKTIEGSKTPINCLCFSPDGTMLAAAQLANRLIVYDAETYAMIKELHIKRQFGFFSLDFSPDGRYIVCSSGLGNVFIWELPTWNLVQTLKASNDKINSVDFDPTGRYIAIGDNNYSVKIFTKK